MPHQKYYLCTSQSSFEIFRTLGDGSVVKTKFNLNRIQDGRLGF